MDENKMTQQEEIHEREAMVVLFVLGAAIVAAVLWVVHSRLFLTTAQLIELPALPLPAVAFAISVLGYFATRRLRIEEQWPRTFPAIAPRADRKHLAKAAAKDAVLVGYRTNGSPFYWANHLRS